MKLNWNSQQSMYPAGRKFSVLQTVESTADPAEVFSHKDVSIISISKHSRTLLDAHASEFIPTLRRQQRPGSPSESIARNHPSPTPILVFQLDCSSIQLDYSFPRRSSGCRSSAHYEAVYIVVKWQIIFICWQ